MMLVQQMLCNALYDSTLTRPVATDLGHQLEIYDLIMTSCLKG